jgi:hypothetical protein
MTPSTFVIRLAHQDEAEEIAKVVQLAFLEDPETHFRFPYCDKYPEDNLKWKIGDYETYLRDPEKYITVVATLPSRDPEKNCSKIIAVAVWNTALFALDKDSEYSKPNTLVNKAD